MEIKGKKVVDATKPTVIHITARDTKVGKNKNPETCAAARAAKRGIPNCISARVHLGRTYIEEKDKWLRYITPGNLRSEIIAFDRGGKFMAGDYELLPPSKTERLRAPRKQHEGGQNSAASKRKLHVIRGVRPHGANYGGVNKAGAK